MHNPDPTASSHGDGQPGFGHTVHRGGYERHIQHDVSRKRGSRLHLIGQHIAEPRYEHDIIKREPLEAVKKFVIVAHAVAPYRKRRC